MKLPLFVLGFLTGTLATYLILTRFWWPDVRLDAARAARPVAAIATATPSPDPAAFATPQAATAVPEPSPSPLTSQATPSPAPPVEVRSADLPILQTDLERLRARNLMIPVQGIEGKTLRDTFMDDRGGRRHEAMDIMAARNTPVLAAGDGRVEKVFMSKAGGLTLYQFDPQNEYCYYYAHLDGYAPGIEPGKVLRKGDVIGYVGSTGNASPAAPHLHFSIFRLGPDRRWWEGTPVNVHPLWSPGTDR